MTERMLVRRRAGNLWRNKGLISTGAASRANTEPTQCRMKLGRDDLDVACTATFEVRTTTFGKEDASSHRV
jgi:hypothetical protein